MPEEEAERGTGGPAPAERPVREPIRFEPRSLDSSVIALPLLAELNDPVKEQLRIEAGERCLDVIIDLNLNFEGGRQAARDEIMAGVKRIADGRAGAIHELKTQSSQQYVFARLTPEEIKQLAREDVTAHRGADMDGGAAPRRAIYKIWLDHDILYLTNKSVSTVKADAARNAFGALGSDIVWAVLDTGIDEHHPQFEVHGTLKLDAPLEHRDFAAKDGQQTRTDAKGVMRRSALVDVAGHGTHVAGIIAGEFDAGKAGRLIGGRVPAEKPGQIASTIGTYNDDGTNSTSVDVRDEGAMGGMAPRARILSLKVLDQDGAGKASNIIAALEYIQDLNSNGRRIVVHGVNLSVGYGFEPAWFACGQSPICVEVNRLVRSGVVVVVAAGNTGYGYNQPAARGPRAAGLDITINDPGNAELAITVGSTHREMPHVYGVSYFSSKGPTGDGRLKPDIVAPGEKIQSCASGDMAGMEPCDQEGVVIARYREDSGTSMAAPHVSGVIAAFLSIRREFIGEPERVKAIFLGAATDLGRAPYFQGRGLVDLMRAIQSV